MFTQVYLAVVIWLGLTCAGRSETARVCELNLRRFVDSQYDLQILVYQRDGEFYHGYARLPQRDNLPHRIDPTPAAPFEFFYPNGERLKIKPEWKGTYAYWDDEWKKLRSQYEEGKLKRRRYDEPKAIALNGGRLTGAIDVWVMPVDEPNNWGLNAPKSFQTYRIFIEATESDGSLKVTFEAWSYDGRDETFGKDTEHLRGSVNGRWLQDFWKPKPGSEYAEGKDWPAARVPHLNGSAFNCDGEIVDNLHDARLLWVAEEIIPAGKGGAPKVAFGFYPANWSGLGYGAYGGPVFADGKVYTYFMYTDEEKLEANTNAKQHILCVRGADVRLVAAEFNALQDAVYCFDASGEDALEMAI